ncbi:hypothetical protein I7I50_00563 [Histoplasma capsulatum G186AR]|uniref:Uncharacterized protein n=1 Tax=Ajellomyces capsulatus TaxID=5037 RepID=A0A8H8CUV1_AJECA|nr:hypothetical protein I7I52_07831 [Histoplasma capsulatum]QSS72648.1 hypothetical protein I7I50_00563 [Histoplasma capsulatum G186AR]
MSQVSRLLVTQSVAPERTKIQSGPGYRVMLGRTPPRPRTDVVFFPRVKRSWLLADLGFSSSPLTSLFIQEKRKSNHVSPRIDGTGAEISARMQNLLLGIVYVRTLS